MNTLVAMAAAVCMASTGGDFPQLTVPKVDLGPAPAIERVDSLLEAGGFALHEIGNENIRPESSGEKPDVHFRVAHSGDEIYIKYYVTEGAIRAVYDSDGNRPWEESCVEFFVIPGAAGDDVYYNIEMSCIGYGILQGGALGNRSGLRDGVAKIRRLPSLPREAFGIREGKHSWTLTLAIPVEVFSLTPVPPLSGRVLKANFYKCGNLLPEPHWVTWSPVDAANFHTPQFFGELVFE